MVLVNGAGISLLLFLFFRNTLTPLDSLFIHINSIANWASSMKTPLGFWLELCWIIGSNLDIIGIFMPLSHSIHKYDMLIYLFRSFLISFNKILLFLQKRKCRIVVKNTYCGNRCWIWISSLQFTNFAIWVDNSFYLWLLLSTTTKWDEFIISTSYRFCKNYMD